MVTQVCTCVLYESRLAFCDMAETKKWYNHDAKC